MGQFSWVYSDTRKAMKDNKRADSYLLVPPPFQEKYGKYILEECYDGYGHFGRWDIYKLIAEWNREHIPEIIKMIKAGKWECRTDEGDIKILQEFYQNQPVPDRRWVGILMGCYTKDNKRLQYPIKITTVPMEYEEAKPSRSDPNQGW